MQDIMKGGSGCILAKQNPEMQSQKVDPELNCNHKVHK